MWSAAHAFAVRVYGATGGFPAEERFGFRSQLRRAAASVAAIPVEGCSRHSDASFAAFVDNAHGSASEAEYHLLLARDVGYLVETEYTALTADLDKIRRLLASLRRTLRASRRHA